MTRRVPRLNTAGSGTSRLPVGSDRRARDVDILGRRALPAGGKDQQALIDSGANLEGKYEVLEPLRGGGMGEVYLVRHLHLQELRVIKLLRRDLAKDPTAAQRFHREARTATQIKHPHVATLYDYSRLPDGRFYMVWEYIQGEDVASLLRRRGPLPVVRALDLGVQVLRGLEAVHAADVIHRDLSPDNLMLTTDRQGNPWVKIIDLGLAKSLAGANAFETQDGSFGGKLRYCSPEQAGLAVGGLDHRSDLYSFSVVLYEMITGLLPFDADKPASSLLERFERPPLPLRGRNPKVDVPRELEQVMERALAHSRDERYQDATSLMAALLGVMDKLQRAAARARQVSKVSTDQRKRILSNIGRAQKRVEETSRLIGEADRAVKSGRFDLARSVIVRLEELDPKVLGLAELKRRLTEAESRKRRMQVMQTEEMIEQYLLEGRASVARIALDTLVELAPEHPGRARFAERIELLEKKSQDLQDTHELVLAGRASLSAGDFDEAERRLAELESRQEHSQAEALRRELEASRVEEEQAARRTAIMEKLDGSLAGGRLEEVEAGVQELRELGVAKVTLDLYQHRLAETRELLARESKVALLEKRYPEALAAESWDQARELALELEAAQPKSPRPGEMFAEIARLQEESRRQAAIADGTATLESLLTEGRLAEAEIAWKVLSEIAPRHPQRRKLERQLRNLRKRHKE